MKNDQGGVGCLDALIDGVLENLAVRVPPPPEEAGREVGTGLAGGTSVPVLTPPRLTGRRRPITVETQRIDTT